MIAIAWKGVVGFPLRALLGALSLIVAITGLVAVNAASGTIEQTVLQRALLTGGPSHTFMASGLNGHEGVLLRDSVLGLFTSRYGASASRVASIDNLVSRKSNGASLGLDVTFVDPQFRDLRPFPVLAGRWLGKSWFSPRICVNESAAVRVGLGERVELRSPISTDTIFAVVSCIVDDGSPNLDAYMLFSAAESFMVNNPGDAHLAIQFTAARATTDSLRAQLVNQGALRNQPLDWSVARTDTLALLAGEVAATQSAFGLTGLLGLLAAIFAIANIGLSTVRERSSEFSLRRALGASRLQLGVIFILETQIIAIGSALVAAPLAYLLYPLLAKFFGAPFGVMPPPFPWGWAVAGIGIGMLAEAVGSLPALLRALRVPISGVMRE